MRAILLEDHPLVLTAVSEHLRTAISDCEIAYGGGRLEDALDVIATGPIDVALVDLDLGDGRAPDQVVAPLVAAGIPVIVMSAHDQPGQVQAAVGAGAYAYIPKRSLIDQFVPAMHGLHSGTEYISTDFAAALVPGPEIAMPDEARRALVLYAAGMPSAAIAVRLGVDDEHVTYLLRTAIAAYRH